MEYDALTICDAGYGNRMDEPYSTPVVIPDTANPAAKVLLWTEHYSTNSSVHPSYQFWRFEGAPSARVCSMVSEVSELLYLATMDGLLWEYHSGRAQQLVPTEWRILGYSGRWPRFRSGNDGVAW